MHDPQPSRLEPGLYIVATPIGNLGDLSPRAADILARADLIAVEDSRMTAKLLQRIGVKRPMLPYHDHNADRVRPGLVERCAREAVALVSDAGTPLISDPGFKLVRAARAAGCAIVTLPGPCAAIAALTLAGLPTDRFLFLGFLPPKAPARAEAIAEVAGVRATLVLYESGPRLAATLGALADGLGAREAAVAREISKAFEECVTGTLPELAARYAEAPPKGELVVVVAPPGEAPPPDAGDVDAALRDAMTRLPVARAAGEVAKATGLSRRDLYARAMALKGRGLKREAAEARGRAGEETAARWLEARGWTILARRVRTKAGEVDLVAGRPGLIAFVEVKTRVSPAALEFAIDAPRLARVAAAAELLAERFARAGEDIRVDVLLVTPGHPPRHIENAWIG